MIVKNDKQTAAEAAIDYIKDGMIVGLGSGSTVNYMIEALAERIQREGLSIQTIPASKKSEQLATELGVPLTSFSEYKRVDIAIDGADEVDSDFQLLKGGGGSLVREKLIAAAADYFVVIVDQSKLVRQLGAFPLPVEVVPFAWKVTEQHIQQLGCRTSRRYQGDHVFVSDNGNYIIDCSFEQITEPSELHQQLKTLTGVVDTGLFLNMADEVIAAEHGKLHIRKRKQ
ncbi:ribose-5-phosphate isomerase RpiA [Gracilibacillus phocaeensis]|uniref:ribose-5-phosphate isomerase RpiA n=1 Tax=Gracilibacillus phocaeensis TaxID=2042304 RepID=UPI0010320D0E|nr:ribose-5-phosphate isomerase RpiA [Gracilibacillus phocaeensis]